MIITDAHIINFLIESIKMINDRDFQFDKDRFSEDGLLVFKEELKLHADIRFEVIESPDSQKVYIKISESLRGRLS